MNYLTQNLAPLSRREMLTRSGMGMGMLALAGLTSEENAQASNSTAAITRHHPAQAKQVVHLFMNGGPSHVDTFDPKPLLKKFHGKPLPNPSLPTERKTAGALSSPFQFKRYGESGIEVSELFQKTAAAHIDDMCIIRSMHSIQLCVGCIVGVTLALVGFCMLGYFQTFPGELPASIDLKKNADDIFPYVISYQLPIGISGLVVAAMFAAAMSSIDSGVNSITAVISTDFIDRFGKSFSSEKSHVRFARYLAFMIGIVVIYCSSYMGEIEGNITEVTGKTANLLTTPIFCLFVFALFIPFAKPLGVWVGSILGTATAVVVAFSGFSYDIDISTYMFEFHGQINLEAFSFQWIAPCAVTVNLVTGSIVSLLISDTKKNSVESTE